MVFRKCYQQLPAGREHERFLKSCQHPEYHCLDFPEFRCKPALCYPEWHLQLPEDCGRLRKLSEFRNLPVCASAGCKIRRKLFSVQLRDPQP